MPTASELLAEIEDVLPHVPKPVGSAVSFHESACVQCEFFRNDLETYVDPVLPDEAVRWLSGELTLLSAEGLRWVLPSYLRRCVAQDAECDAMETEFLIYTLVPAQEHEAEAAARLSSLSLTQLRLLEHFLEWCAAHPYWSEYCHDDIERARAFTSAQATARSAA